MSSVPSDRTPIFVQDLIKLGLESKVYANVTSYQGYDYVHIRVYLHSYSNDGTMVPTKTGACLKTQEWNNLIALQDAVHERIREVKMNRGQVPENPVCLGENSKFYISITSWKEEVKVHIRVFDLCNSKLIPQKKGIALSLNEWDCLMASQNEILAKMSNDTVYPDSMTVEPPTPIQISPVSHVPITDASGSIRPYYASANYLNPWSSTPRNQPSVVANNKPHPTIFH